MFSTNRLLLTRALSGVPVRTRAVTSIDHLHQAAGVQALSAHQFRRPRDLYYTITGQFMGAGVKNLGNNSIEDDGLSRALAICNRLLECKLYQFTNF